MASSKRARFMWNEDKLNLIKCLLRYKTAMEFHNSDSNADKVKMYQSVRERMAEIYCECRRSGSGPVILEYYEELLQIWGSSPATQALNYGTQTSSFENTLPSDEQDIEEDGSIQGSEGRQSIIDSNDYGEGSTDQILEDEMIVSSTPNIRKTNQKRSADSGTNPTPKLIDNKRKHMERQLSASQRDKLLLQESQEEASFRQDMVLAIRESNETFSKAIQQMSNSMMQVATGLNKSLEIIGKAMLQPERQSGFSSYSAQPYYNHYENPNINQANLPGQAQAGQSSSFMNELSNNYQYAKTNEKT